jgi:curved DNA-binding protein CbpA
MNPYEVLEISPGASAEEIKAAYHRLAKLWHPDRFSGAEKQNAEERFRALAEAFNALKDVSRQESKPSVPVAPAPTPAPSVTSAPSKERTPEEWLADAKSAFEQRDFDRVQGLVHYCIRINGEKAEYYLLIAKSLDLSGGDKKALVKAYENVIRLNPKDADSMIRLAEIFRGLDMHARAARLWESARALAPQHKAFRAEAKRTQSAPEGLSAQFSELVEKIKNFFKRLSNRG